MSVYKLWLSAPTFHTATFRGGPLLMTHPVHSKCGQIRNEGHVLFECSLKIISTGLKAFDVSSTFEDFEGFQNQNYE